MKKISSKRVPVWICAVNGAVLDMSALSYGPLAVTRALARFQSGFDDRYAVTHVPTGLALLNYVPFARAKAACVAFIESGPWAKVTPQNAKRYGKKVKTVLKSVGIELP